jgi:LytS/YehU family sensor histidine kinase
MVIEQYLSLQRLRFGEEVLINTSFIEEDKSIMVEPMLLIPIIENAFKHGTSMISAPVIDISIRSEDGVLYLNIKNKFSPNASSSLTNYSGLGLANIKRRLELLYPKKYEFKEEIENGEWFIILLKINCR